jgi:hypothetical protein
MKYCNKCRKEKAETEFYRRARSLDGLCAICKVCGDSYIANRLKCDSAYRARHYETTQRYHHRIHEEVYQLLGNACRNCGNNDRRVLQFDHIDNDGHLERPFGRASGGGSYKRDLQIRKQPSRFQILCANCHAIKTFEHRKSLECTTGALCNNSPQSNPTQKEIND